jgi:hypothetical protein
MVNSLMEGQIESHQCRDGVRVVLCVHRTVSACSAPGRRLAAIRATTAVDSSDMGQNEVPAEGEGSQSEREPFWRNRSWRTWFVAGVVALVVLVALCAWVGSLLRSTDNKSLSFPGVTQLEIDVGSGDVELVASQTADVEVQAKSTYYFRAPSSTAASSGGALRLGQECGGLRIGRCSTHWRVAVPAGVTVGAKVRHGSLSANGLQGSAGLRTSNGSLTVRKSYGSLTLDSTGGKITGSELSSLDVKAASDGGRVKLGFTSAPVNVDVRTDSGDVEVQVPKKSGAFAVVGESPQGKVTIDVQTDANSPRHITARSASGDVSVESS